MSRKPTIVRADIVRSISDERLDDLLGEPYKRDDPDRVAKMAERLSWACALGVSELSQYIDLAKHDPLDGLYREYAVLFALFHLERTTKGGASQPSRDDYDQVHKNLGMAHKGERLPGEREQRSVVAAEVIEDASRWSAERMQGFE